MITLFYDKKNNDVNLTYYIEPPKDLETLPHYKVKELPEPEERLRFHAVLKCDGEKVWYEYKEQEVNDIESKIEKLEKQLELANATITELVLNSYEG